MHMLPQCWLRISKITFIQIKTMASNSINLIEESFEDIRSQLMKFEGGHVSLVKDESNGIATICLDNPEKRNAMSGVMMVEFRDCVDVLEKWNEGKGLIICGKGSNFCSGGDLEFAKANGTSQAGLNMSTWMQDALNRLQKLPLISTCLVQGPTLGGGAEISIFCDYIIASENLKYGFVHGKMGITTAWGGGVRLAKKIGVHKALDVLLTAKILSAKECVDIGLVEVIVPPEESFAKCLEWLTSRLLHHHSITRAFKEIVLNTNTHTYEDALRLEKFIFAPFWGGQINKEALNRNIKHVGVKSSSSNN